MDKKTKVDIFEFLDILRDMGHKNMYGVSQDIMYHFELDKTTSRKLLAEWMQTKR